MVLLNCNKWGEFIKRKVCIITAMLIGGVLGLIMPASAFADTAKFNINGKTWQFSDREMNFLKMISIVEMISYLNGENTIMKIQPSYKGEEIFPITARELDKEYHKNEVSADLKYKNKYLFVTGIIDSINKGIGDNYYILFRGSENMFMQPHASMDDGYHNYLANLNKGDKISLLCKDGGMIIGSVTLRKCIPGREIVENSKISYLHNMQKQIDEGNKTPIELLAYVEANTSLLPTKSACFVEGNRKDCLSELSKIPNEEFKKALNEAHLKYGLPPIKETVEAKSEAAENTNVSVKNKKQNQKKITSKKRNSEYTEAELADMAYNDRLGM